MINEKFNALTVIRQSGTVKHGRNNVKVWLCRCDCGETLEVDQNSLKKGTVPACKICRRGPCVICGSKITDPTFSVKRNTCSEACRKEQKRRSGRKRYAKLTNEDPDHNKNRYKQRLDANPDFNKIKYQRKKLRFNTLDNDQKAVINKKNSAYTTAWRKRWLEMVKSDSPEKYEHHLKMARRTYRKHQAKKRLAKLMTTQIKGKENE